MQNHLTLTPTGIDDISVYIPSLYLDIKDFAQARDIEVDRLRKGLGLQAIAIPDSSEDVITMASEAVLDLVVKNNIRPEDLGRIYVGTESAVDGSKPIASYILGVLSKYYEDLNLSSAALKNCDVVDLTFACIGAVDAMQNCLDWVKLNPHKKAIVVSTDNAKYDLHSPGESTQGAGALAILITSSPRMLEISSLWGVASKCEHDFFKPIRRSIDSRELIVSNGIDASLLGREIKSIHKETPVYDGRYSNQCYADRIEEALAHFLELKEENKSYMNQWEKFIFHLPYAYHARRVFSGIFEEYLKETGQWEAFAKDNLASLDKTSPKYDKFYYKAITSSEEYKSLVSSKIEHGERASSLVGNMYTGSIFLSLISTLSLSEGGSLEGKKIGFFAYGSGSKSKVFEATIKSGYRTLIDRIGLFEKLNERESVNINQYEYLHRNKLLFDIDSKNRRIFQESSGCTTTNRFARNYSLHRNS